MRVGYVVKRYPRFSETFIVSEILAHEAAGLDIEIFSLRPPCDTHFQDRLARVRAPVTYLPAHGVKAADFWDALQRAAPEMPDLDAAMAVARDEPAEDVYQALLLAIEVRRRGIEHLHAHFATLAAAVARLAARFAGIPYTFTAHAKDIYHASVRPDDLRRRLADAAGVVTVSDFNLAHLRATYGTDARRVRRIYNGIDLAEFAYDDPVDRAPRILAVGRLVEKKGFADLVDACAILAGDGRLFRCEIVGAGPLEADLRARVEGHGLGGRVELTGALPRIEVRARLRLAAVLAAPCTTAGDGDRDGLPTVLLEAMASGTPCVSTDVTGIPEIVRDGVTGMAVLQRDPITLAAAIWQLLDHPARRITIARGARQLVEREFDIHANAARLRAMFHARAGAAMAEMA